MENIKDIETLRKEKEELETRKTDIKDNNDGTLNLYD